MIELAATLARHVLPGDVLAVEGPLGSGKTTFVRGLARALLGADPVTSPTFTFRHTYRRAGAPALEHLDLYRIDDEAELVETGLEEAFGEDVVTVVEWADHAPSLVARPTWRITIAGSGEGPRTVSIARGA